MVIRNHNLRLTIPGQLCWSLTKAPFEYLGTLSCHQECSSISCGTSEHWDTERSERKDWGENGGDSNFEAIIPLLTTIKHYWPLLTMIDQYYIVMVNNGFYCFHGFGSIWISCILRLWGSINCISIRKVWDMTFWQSATVHDTFLMTFKIQFILTWITG